MKPAKIKPGDRMSPRQQHNWDWRAASNFIAGGAGGGLLFFAALANLGGTDVRALLVVGMALIGIGLTCVWFEIGRPWRALNVYRHFSSWMMREAVVAPIVFACGVLALFTGQPPLVLLTGLFGGFFIYSQARILSADKGIPAWRHARCRPLVVSTGFAEGAGLLAIAAPLLVSSAQGQVGVAVALLVMLLVRVLLWRSYVAGLRADGAPDGTLRALKAIQGGVMMLGTLAPIVLLAIAVVVGPAAGIALSLAGLLAVGAGWLLKFTLVRRAAFTQGFALKHLPVRGRGAAGAAVKPGWGSAN